MMARRCYWLAVSLGLWTHWLADPLSHCPQGSGGGSGRLWVRLPASSSSSSSTALRPMRCWMDGSRVGMAGQQAAACPRHRAGSAGQGAGRSSSPLNTVRGQRQPAWPPLPLRAASATTAGEEGKLLQGTIRNISAFAAPRLHGPTRALPPARGPGPAALLPPEPPAPAPLHSPILGELLEKQQPVFRRAAGSLGPGGWRR